MPKKGYKMSEEHKKKIGESCKGKPAWNKGKKGLFHHTEEHKKRMSELRKGKWVNSPESRKIMGRPGRKMSMESRLLMSSQRKGDKHWNWDGGKTTENLKIRNGFEIKLWRTAVFTRDNWICQKCKKGSNKLNAHHILPFRDYIELRTVLENGITFCKSCHLKFHSIYGKYDNNREQINEYVNG